VILETIGSLVVGAIGAGIGWAATEFLARPIRKFYDLRSEVIQKMALYANVPARANEEQDGKVTVLDVSEAEAAKLDEARDVTRDMATRMRAFAFNETWAAWVLRLRYDPWRAAEGLIGVSNTVHIYGPGKARSKKIVADALRIPEHVL
jgi:hypothetical protein